MVGDSSVPSGFRRLSGRLGKAAGRLWPSGGSDRVFCGVGPANGLFQNTAAHSGEGTGGTRDVSGEGVGGTYRRGAWEL